MNSAQYFGSESATPDRAPVGKARALLLDVFKRCSRERWAQFPPWAQDVRGHRTQLGIVVFGLQWPSTWSHHLRALEAVVAANPWLAIRALVDDNREALERFRNDPANRYEVISVEEFFDNYAQFHDCIVVDRYCTWYPGVRYGARLQKLGIPVIRFEQFLNAPSIETPGYFRTHSDYVLAHLDELLELERVWADDRSREVYYTSLAAFLSMDFTYFALTCDDYRSRYFPSDVGFRFHDREILADCGSNDGSEIEIFTSKTSDRFVAIHAFEPDRQNFMTLSRNMSKYMGARGIDNIYSYPLGVYDQNSYLQASGEGTAVTLRLDKAADGNGVFVGRLDDLIECVTHVRLEVEGSEVPALRGAQGLIRRCKPKLAVSTYHCPDDFITIYKTIREMDVGYEFRLRHQSLEAGILCFYCC